MYTKLIHDITRLRELAPTSDSALMLWDVVEALERMELLEQYVEKHREPCDCGSTEEVTLDSDPYLSEIHGDASLRWQCEECRSQSVENI